MAYRFSFLIFLVVSALPGNAQDLSGIWFGEARNLPKMTSTPVGMAINQLDSKTVMGNLNQQFDYGYFVNFHLKGTLLAKTLVVTLDSVIKDRHPDIPEFHWWAAPITLTYNEREETLIGRNSAGSSNPSGGYTFTLYRLKLKSSPLVLAATTTTLRVSGHYVRWYADPTHKQPVAQGNTFRTRLFKTTTFYLRQEFDPSHISPVTTITIKVKAPVKKPLIARQMPHVATATPVVLPAVLFYNGTATLLPTATPALASLAAELSTNPSRRLRIAGHTDRVGEPTKNLVLSQQRALAVRLYLINAGIAPDRLETIGYGDTRELFPSPDARNRRVEITPIP